MADGLPKFGDHVDKPPKTVPAEQRFARYVSASGESCHLWTGARSSNFYGSFRRGAGDDVVNAHRFAYESTFGPIPKGLHVDHVCTVRSCVNPAHLQLVTPAQNALLARVRTGYIDIYTWEELLLQGIAVEVHDLQRFRNGESFPWSASPRYPAVSEAAQDG